MHYTFIEFILLLYTSLVISFARYKEYIIYLISFSRVSDVLPAFTCASAIGNLWSMCLGVNTLSLRKKILTLERISPRNIYLNLFGEAHFHQKSLKACGITKITCLSYVWTSIFHWSSCWLKLRILHLFRARSSKTKACRFTLKRVRDMIIIYSYSK